MPDHFKFLIEFFKDYFPMPFILIILINTALWKFHTAWHLPTIMPHKKYYIIFNVFIFIVLILWDIHVKNKIKEKDPKASQIFPDMWRCSFENTKTGDKGIQDFIIALGNQYHVQNGYGKLDYTFDIKECKIKGNKISFVKYLTLISEVFSRNDLVKKNKNIMVGVENNFTKVVYQRLNPLTHKPIKKYKNLV